MMGWGWNGGGWNGGGAWGIASEVLMLVFFAALVVGVVLVVRALLTREAPSTDGRQSGPPPVYRGYEPASALRILEERYARGEIDREEFLARRQDLQS
ncbi:MAG: SHOCT domain-containing protein [Actinobacteria bacterium]|nr:SHOCT domain-containing protein [Actinomycetota bacterium]